MDKSLLRARIEEILDSYDSATWDPDVKEEVVDSIVTEVTKLDMEALFDAEELDEGDDLDAG